jgi:hypothetical protein
MSDNTTNHAIATGRGYVDYDPLTVLKELRAAIGYNAGYVIRLGDSQDAYLYRRLVECIDFNEGRESSLAR